MAIIAGTKPLPVDNMGVPNEAQETMGMSPDGALANTPGRMGKRKAALKNLEGQAQRMRKRAAERDGGGNELAPGTIVQLALQDVDRGKTDNPNATMIVVEKVGATTYRIANKAGVYKELVTRAYLKPLPAATPQLLGFAHIMGEWEGMPKVGIRAVAASASHVGGQGMLRCACTGPCTTARCACRKAKRVCNSRCHKGRSCQNLEECDE